MGYGLGTNFDSHATDSNGNYLLNINGEPLLLPGYPLFESASNDDNRSLTMIKVYQIYADDFIPLALYQPRKGQSVSYMPTNSAFIVWYQVESVEIERLGSQIIEGSETIIHVQVRIKLSLLTEPQSLSPGTTPTYTDPWDLPPYNFKMGTELVDDSVQTYYDATTVDENHPIPAQKLFVNTAGVPLQTSRTRPLVRMSFSFNLEGFDPKWTYSWTGAINDREVTICGITFAAGQVKLESLGMEVCYEDRDIPDVDEDDQPITVTERVYYSRCDVVLLIDPQYDPYGTGLHGWMRRYLNVGTNILRGDGLHRLWCATSQMNYLYQVWKMLNELDEEDENRPYAVTEESLREQFCVAANRMLNTNYTDPEDVVEDSDWDDATTGIQYNGLTVYGTATEMAYFKDPEEVTENMFLNEDGTGVQPTDASGRQIPTFLTGFIENIVTFDSVVTDLITQQSSHTGFLYPEDGSVSGFILPTEAPYIWNYEITDVQPSNGL